jgi:assimilatory nitrate reductase catalytic subunit
VTAPTRTTCPYCGVGCGVLADAGGAISGDPAHPANFGRLCSKGAALGETLGLAERLLHPMVDGGRTSWDAALDRIAGEFSRAIAAHGPDAVALYVSGQFLTEDYYVANKLMKGFVGSANIDTNSRLCMASSVAGLVRAFGEDVVPGCYEDLEAADLVVLVGSNLAWCHPVLFQRLGRARVVVIDPRRTATCERADLHLKLRAGSDVVLFAGLLVWLADTGSIDRDWIARHVAGFDESLAAARIAAPSLERIAELTGLPAIDIAIFYDWFATTPRTVTAWSQGVNQSSAGTDKVNAIINCHLATGRIGKPGATPLSLTGQPNAMGGREVGGLANQLAAHLAFADPGDRDLLRRFWQAPRLAERPGLKAVELFDAVHDGRIKALWILGTNPAASMPSAAHVREALERCDFVAVSEVSATSDTAHYADVLLPAAAWGEKDGTVTNSERRISRQRSFRSAPGEARPDWWALAAVASRMGWAEQFAWSGPAAIFREHAALTACENGGRRVLDLAKLAELSEAAYDALEPTQWGGERLFAAGGFPTQDRRARMIATTARPPAALPDDDYPYVLNTGRIRDQWHTMTRTGGVPRLMAHVSEPCLALHPADAAQLAIEDGMLVRVASPHGEAVLRAALSPDQRPGEVFAPMHWTDWYSSSSAIGRVVGPAVDPVSGQPELKATPVRLAALAMRWHGLLLRRDAPALPREIYWARIPIAGGIAFELAGPSATREDLTDALLGAAAGCDRVDYRDPARGIMRQAILRDGILDAVLFIARERNALPGRAALGLLLGTALDDASRHAILAGRAAGQRNADPLVCACFAVGLATIRQTIAERKLASVGEIGALLKAGTNCGSCLPELKQILAGERPAA